LKTIASDLDTDRLSTPVRNMHTISPQKERNSTEKIILDEKKTEKKEKRELK
jgi:hypothetical protein